MKKLTNLITIVGFSSILLASCGGSKKVVSTTAINAGPGVDSAASCVKYPVGTTSPDITANLNGRGTMKLYAFDHGAGLVELAGEVVIESLEFFFGDKDWGNQLPAELIIGAPVGNANNTHKNTRFRTCVSSTTHLQLEGPGEAYRDFKTFDLRGSGLYITHSAVGSTYLSGNTLKSNGLVFELNRFETIEIVLP